MTSPLAPADLPARVAAAEDRVALKHLTHSYGYFLEKGLWSDIVDLFSDTASVEYTGGPYIGKTQVRRYFLDRFGGGRQGLPRGRLANHIMMQGILSVSPDRREGRGRWRSLIENQDLQPGFNWLEGGYEFNYSNDGDRWRIQKIHYVARVFGTFTTGWLDEATPRGGGSGASADPVPPSGPPTEQHQPFPAVYAPPRPDPFTKEEPSPSVHASTADLRQRLARLADRDSIENLQNAFGYCFDKKLWSKAAELFAPDGRYVVDGAPAFIGAAAMVSGWSSRYGAGLRRGDLFNHQQLMPVITVSEDRRSALGRWRFLAQLARDGADAAWSEGVLENRYVRSGGRWLIADHHVYANSRTPYGAADWNTTAPADNADGRAPFPDYFTPSFHYPNPVTGRPIAIPEAP